MDYLHRGDYAVIIIYFLILVGIGLYLKKKASASMEDYFLGGRKLPWWALGISGMASFLDITGTMMIVSFLFILGPRGLFIEFRGGAVLVLAVMMLWSGKWHRRSGCITNAEWMIYRFGDTASGRFARIAGAVAGIASTIGMLAYLAQGVGLFLSMFVPLPPWLCALILITIATVYTLTSGFYGVVYTDIIQSAIILVAVIGISFFAFAKVTSAEQIGALAYEVTGQSEWMSSACSWHTTMPKGYEQYSFLFIIAGFYLFRNIFYGMGAGGEPKYFGARTDAECSKLTFFWTNLMMFRWPMMMGFAVLGLFLVKDFFPNQEVLSDAALLIKTQIGTIDKTQWANHISNIINSPQKFPPEFMAQLQEILGESWQIKLHLLSYEGTVNPERILPAVILRDIHFGFRGLILIALIAACMSTFDSILNMTIGFFTRDIYQAYLKPDATNRQLIRMNWLFGVILVAVSYLFGYTAESINDIWDWFIMALGGGLVVPSVLRFYWARFNGGGFAIGTVVGLMGAVLMRVGQMYFADLSPFLAVLFRNPASQFFTTVMIGLIGAVVGTYLTRPTNRNVLEHFYKTTRPFGLWGTVKQTLDADIRVKMQQEHRRDILALPFAVVWQITLFLLPMQLIIKSYRAFAVTFVIFAVSLAGLYWVWLRHQKPENEIKSEIGYIS
jgi:Na+/proline symporter